MISKTSRVLLSVILSISVITGAYLAWQRHVIENESRRVELVMDLNDLKVLSSLSKVPLARILDGIKQRGVTSIGIHEQTLPEASSTGEIYYVTGAGIVRYPHLNPRLNSLMQRGLIDPAKAYILCENDIVRQRMQDQLHMIMPNDKLRNIGRDVLEYDEGEIMMRDAGVGISEASRDFLVNRGFRLIPRIRNDRRYNIAAKIHYLKPYGIIIFDGEEILGYPDNIGLLGRSMNANRMTFGQVEIIRQYGSDRLRKMMGERVVKVHSISQDELKKTDRRTAVARFKRAAKERSVRMFYVRPFLPPYIDEDPVAYNLDYLTDVRMAIESDGFTAGRASAPRAFAPAVWQIFVLGIGVVIVTILLISYFAYTPWWLMWLVLILSAFGMVAAAGSAGDNILLIKGLSLLAAVVFPSYAVISQFSPEKTAGRKNIIFGSLNILMHVVMDTVLGAVLILGLMSGTSFMIGTHAFLGVKAALILPIVIVAYYFFFKTEHGFDLSVFKARAKNMLEAKLPVWSLAAAAAAVLALALLLARSGNFVIPVPEFEKALRTLLEQVMSARPRTKEFLIGYPAIMLSALFLMRKKEWALPVLLAIGVIGPVSLINTFCHIHTPVIVSLLRSFNGLVLGAVIGTVLVWAASKAVKE